MKKEVLTIENIKKDSRRYFFDRIKTLLMLFLSLTPPVCIAVLNADSFFSQGRSAKTIVVTVLFAVCFILISYVVVTIIIGLIQIKNASFTITSDWVVDKPRVVIGKSRRSSTYRIIFAKSGAFDIPKDTNYKWSNQFATPGKTLYEYTDINEDFYVISLGQKNVMAYRKKHFELEEKQK